MPTPTPPKLPDLMHKGGKERQQLFGSLEDHHAASHDNDETGGEAEEEKSDYHFRSLSRGLAGYKQLSGVLLLWICDSLKPLVLGCVLQFLRLGKEKRRRRFVLRFRFYSFSLLFLFVGQCEKGAFEKRGRRRQ